MKKSRMAKIVAKESHPKMVEGSSMTVDRAKGFLEEQKGICGRSCARSSTWLIVALVKGHLWQWKAMCQRKVQKCVKRKGNVEEKRDDHAYPLR